METPNTSAGRTTEEILATWLRRLEQRKESRPSTATYNAAYEACLDVLERKAAR